MAETSTDYTLMKLDKIEDLVREVKQLLQERIESAPVREMPAPVEPPSTLLGLSLSMGQKAFAWGISTFLKHLPMLGTIVYMKATGQDEKIWLYAIGNINKLLGV